MIGDLRGGSSPSTTCKSVRHTPHACTRTRISPRPGRGTATSVNLRGLVSMGAGAGSKQAFIPFPQKLKPYAPAERELFPMQILRKFPQKRPPLRRAPSSKLEFERQLDQPRRQRAHYVAEKRVVHVTIHGRRSEELRVIEQIERLQAQLQRLGLRNVHIFCQS